MTYCMDEYMNGVSFGDISCDQNPSSSQNFISEIFLPYPQILLRMMIMATDLDWVCGKGSTDILLWIQFLRLCLPPTDPPLFAMLTHISPFISLSLGSWVLWNVFIYTIYLSILPHTDRMFADSYNFAPFPISGENSRFRSIYIPYPILLHVIQNLSKSCIFWNLFPRFSNKSQNMEKLWFKDIFWISVVSTGKCTKRQNDQTGVA